MARDPELVQRLEAALAVQAAHQPGMFLVSREGRANTASPALAPDIISERWPAARMAAQPPFGLHLRAPELIAVLRYRLGCPVYPSAGPCPACDDLCDRLGDHAMNCGTSGKRIGRHNRLCDAVYSAAASAGPGPVLEKHFLLPGGRKPADMPLLSPQAKRDEVVTKQVLLHTGRLILIPVSRGRCPSPTWCPSTRSMQRRSRCCRPRGAV